MKVNLLAIGFSTDIRWGLGNYHIADTTVQSVKDVFGSNFANDKADAWLFWDMKNPLPEEDFALNLLEQRVDVWHAGLKLGMRALPKWIDYVSPSWMLNRDPNIDIEATSWRLSLNACLVHSNVIEQLGFIVPEFATLDAAALEMGHRWITSGAIVRHAPDLMNSRFVFSEPSIPIDDEMRFIFYRYEKKWLLWSAIREILVKNNLPFRSLFSLAKLLLKSKPYGPMTYKSLVNASEFRDSKKDLSVSIIIPTLGRYPYLQKLLPQISRQTIMPYEVIIVDQNPLESRMEFIKEAYPQLSIRHVFQDTQGQCTARNAGLQQSRGDHILFLDDDDDEIPSDLIERHLETLESCQSEVSSGVVHDVDEVTLPFNFTYLRISDVFPTNNTLIKKSALLLSGLFDLAYDKGQLEDGDLGMRLYLLGTKMILNPQISLIHHHAPVGGLRHHKARVYTYAFSRNSFTVRILPSISEIYFARRYFSLRQVREMLWIAVLGTFSIRGPIWKKLIKAFLSLLALPYTILQLRRCWIESEKLILRFPQIPLIQDAQN